MKKYLGHLSRKKRTVLAVSAVGVLLLVGVTIAVSHDRAFFANLFKLGYYQTEFIETFDSPEDWAPCDETPKTVIAKNDSDTKIYVRLKYDEYWRAKDGVTDLPLTKDGITLAEIIFQNETDWNLRDGWYYYKTPLNPGESTSSLFKAVKLSCNADFGTDNVCHDTASGQVCEKPADQYEEARYHLFVTVQTISEDGIHEWIPEQHTADCDNPTLLYDIIACQTLGLDNNLNFNEFANSNNNNRNGVNTLSAHKNDYYPVYYFRGDVQNNYLEYNGFCWRLMRTAEGGATKMIYAGAKSASGCTDTSPSIGSGYFQPPYDGPNTSNRYELAHGGYMFDGEGYYDVALSSFGGHKAGKDVSWDGEKYTLIDYDRFGNPYQTNGRNYICYDRTNPNYTEATECEEVLYFTSFHNSDYAGIRLYGGAKWEDALAAMQTNTKNSNAKNIIDTWYSSNITAHRDYLATDVTYCNDRTILDETPTYVSLVFGGYGRVRGADGSTITPSVDCPKNDAFSVDSSTGNGALTYPVALATIDEYVLAGYCLTTEVFATYAWPGSDRCSGTHGNAYLDSDYLSWTMTPMGHESNNTDMVTVSYWSDISYDSAGGSKRSFRPVLALKNSVEVEGAGTQVDPYRIKE